MSYILDALKQSDDQRKANQEISPLPPVATEVKEERSGKSRYLILAGLMAVLLVGVWVFNAADSGMGKGANEGFEVQEETANSNVSSQEAIVVEQSVVEPPPISKEELLGVRIEVDEAIPQEVPQESAQNIAQQSERQSINKLVDQDEFRVSSQQAESAGVFEKSQKSLPTLNTQASQTQASQASQPVEITDVEKVPAVTEQAKVQVSKPAQVQAQAQKIQPAAQENVIYWRQLPLYIQRDLPPLQFSVHVYAKEPSARMVKYNGRVLHEGDPITSSIMLQHITRDGVILLYKGFRFRMNAV